MIDDFIRQEMEYFEPMLARQRRSSPEQSEVWRKETIRERQHRISLETYDLCGGQVRYGPFSGLKLNRDTWWGGLDLGSQCLGLYEKEILDFIQCVEVGKFVTFIDIGAADGYYSTGMLISRKVSKAICFEISPEGRQAIDSNWKANGSPGSLDIYGEASGQSLSQITACELAQALVLIDIEGAEFDFLTNEVISLLKHATVLIEVHNWAPTFETRYPELLRRLSVHFQIATFQPVERDTTSIAELRSYTDDNRLLITSERRPCVMRFLRLTPKETP